MKEQLNSKIGNRVNLKGILNRVKLLYMLFMVPVLNAACYAESAGTSLKDHPGVKAFASRAAGEFELSEGEVLELLQQAKFRKSIVDAISRPAESKPWFEYRPIFITDERIAGGVEFWRDNAQTVARAAEEFAVDPQIIVAIIGVETFYGRITGGYRVIDALATLSFFYPDTGNDRSAFFSRELMEFLVLGQEEGIPLSEVKGSYAGAMGLGQFMPSSYREYAVDLDGDGRRDLWSSMEDIVGSVANYLHRHGWKPGEPVAVRAEKAKDADESLVARRDFKPGKPVSEISQKGFSTRSDIDSDAAAVVVALEEKEGPSYWLAFDNFYVITRYNRSPLYAMAVLELSEAVLKGMDG